MIAFFKRVEEDEEAPIGISWKFFRGTFSPRNSAYLQVRFSKQWLFIVGLSFTYKGPISVSTSAGLFKC